MNEQIPLTLHNGAKINVMPETIAFVERVGENHMKLIFKGPETVVEASAELEPFLLRAAENAPPPAALLTGENPPPASEPPAALGVGDAAFREAGDESGPGNAPADA